MGLLFDDNSREAKEYGTYPIQTRYDVPVESVPGQLLDIHPYRDNDGIEAGANLLQALHDVRIRDGRNASDAHAFEIWFDRGQFSFRLYAANDRASDRFQRRTTNTYTNSEVTPRTTGPAFPELRPTDHVAAATLAEERHTFLPIRHHNAEGFEHGDPYSDIMGEMLTLDDSLAVVQVVFKPAPKDWTENGPNGESVGDVATDLRNGEVAGFKDPLFWLGIRELEERDSSSKDKEAAKIVEQQRGEQGFHVNVRVLAASPQPREARERARGIASMFAKYYNATSEQGLDHHPVKATDEEMQQLLVKMFERRWIDRGMILSIDEVAGLAHIPNKDIEVPQIPWKSTQSGSQIAAEASKDEANTTDVATDQEASSDDGWPTDAAADSGED
ncbi:hypothetical protein [Halobacterium noricense]|uniref:hypothetical protein n=1 Tax=Halobacterium noricense TaxID=223182 RepID=UPI001E5CA476|nr:hypothetical protein [Halobacterium noricense]UHH27253.1 hypothetical protein LT974_17575 [Halobacterium noricense]